MKVLIPEEVESQMDRLFSIPHQLWQSFYWKKAWWWVQRLFRGYSDCDIWGLNTHLAELLIPRLKALRNLPPHGFPSSLEGHSIVVSESDEEWEKGYQEWLEILDKMIVAFELFLLDGDDLDYGLKKCWIDEETREWHSETDEKVWEETQKILAERQVKIDEGIALFAKHFQNLWD